LVIRSIRRRGRHFESEEDMHLPSARGKHLPCLSVLIRVPPLRCCVVRFLHLPLVGILGHAQDGVVIAAGRRRRGRRRLSLPPLLLVLPLLLPFTLVPPDSLHALVRGLAVSTRARAAAAEGRAEVAGVLLKTAAVEFKTVAPACARRRAGLAASPAATLSCTAGSSAFAAAPACASLAALLGRRVLATIRARRSASLALSLLRRRAHERNGSVASRRLHKVLGVGCLATRCVCAELDTVAREWINGATFIDIHNEAGACTRECASCIAEVHCLLDGQALASNGTRPEHAYVRAGQITSLAGACHAAHCCQPLSTSRSPGWRSLPPLIAQPSNYVESTLWNAWSHIPKWLCKVVDTHERTACHRTAARTTTGDICIHKRKSAQYIHISHG